MSSLHTEIGKTEFEDLSSSKSSRPNLGVIKHLEHVADLILLQSAEDPLTQFSAFKTIVEGLANSATSGTFPFVNEKFDGSPAVVFGFQPDGRAFISYKGGFDRKGKQLLISSQEDLDASYDKEKAMYQILQRCLPFLDSLKELPLGDYRDFIFQADLLFANDLEYLDSKVMAENGDVFFRPNTIEYTISPDNENYDLAKSANIGLIIHTIFAREIESEDSRIATSKYKDPSIISSLSEDLRTSGIFAIDPYRINQAVAAASPLSTETQNKIADSLAIIENTFLNLSSQFQAEWVSRHLKSFKVFLNTFLKNSSDGGLYRDASADTEFNSEQILEQYDRWFSKRTGERVLVKPKAHDFIRNQEPKKNFHVYQNFKTTYETELKSLLNAYYQANRIIANILPSLEEALLSKLGNVKSEGIIIEHESLVLKLVDRLGFTISNNLINQRSTAEDFPLLYSPFNKSLDNLAVLPMKLQPLHAGHIGLIKDAARQLQEKGIPLIIIASDKAPNLSADNYKDLAATDTKKDLVNRNYIYIFSRELREKLLLEAFKKSEFSILILAPGNLWANLEGAKVNGLESSATIVASKREEKRYESQLLRYEDSLQGLFLMEQEDAISGTKVRSQIKEFCLTDDASKKNELRRELRKDFSYVIDDDRFEELLNEICAEWTTLDAVAQKILS